METIENKIRGLIKRSSEILGINQEEIILKIVVDNVIFETESNACVLQGNILHVNENWLNRMNITKDETELRMLIYHEVRHYYQIQQIAKYTNKQPVNEDVLRIMQWKYNFENYISNTNENLSYYNQHVEIDANAFGILMFNYDISRGIKKISGNLTSIPSDIYPEIDKRLKELISFYRL